MHFYDDETVACPYPFYERLRDDEPVHWVEEGGYYLVASRELVSEVAMDPARFSSNLVSIVLSGEAGPQLFDTTALPMRPVDVLAIADPPDHTRQRRLVNRAFSVRRVRALEPAIRERAVALLDRVAATPFDWMAAVAAPLPVGVIADLVGLPEDDVDDLRRYSDAGVSLLSGVLSAADMQSAVIDTLAFQQYLVTRYGEAQASPRDDLLGVLVAAAAEDDGLSDDEAVSILMQLVIAGAESTTSLIGSAAAMLLADPPLRDQLAENPEGIADFIEHVLRLESPFQGHFRVATCDTTLGGVEIAKGSRLMLLWGSANRDGDDGKHLAFGEGIHHCIGASLARLEARVAIEELLKRYPRAELAGGELEYLESVFVRRLASLEVSCARP